MIQSNRSPTYTCRAETHPKSIRAWAKIQPPQHWWRGWCLTQSWKDSKARGAIWSKCEEGSKKKKKTGIRGAQLHNKHKGGQENRLGAARAGSKPKTRAHRVVTDTFTKHWSNASLEGVLWDLIKPVVQSCASEHSEGRIALRPRAAGNAALGLSTGRAGPRGPALAILVFFFQILCYLLLSKYMKFWWNKIVWYR